MLVQPNFTCQQLDPRLLELRERVPPFALPWSPCPRRSPPPTALITDRCRKRNQKTQGKDASELVNEPRTLKIKPSVTQRDTQYG